MAPIIFLQNIPVPAPSTRTSTVGEPSLSNAQNNIFFTGNWYAAESANHGGSWTAVDPFTIFPPVDGGFCCDQTSIYIPQVNLTVWILQYIKSSTSNVMRIAVRTPGGAWRFWNIRPTNVNSSWTNQWFDYNSAALSDKFLYITNNVFTTTTNQWTRAVVMRIPFTSLAQSGPLTFQSFSTTQNGSLRCTLGAKSVMYFGSHNSSSQIRLFTWPESSATVTTQNINVAAWSQAQPYSAKCPDGNDWLSRTDGRITAAWTGNGEIGFAWTSNKSGSRPFPYIRVVRLKETTKAIIGQPDIWNSKWAYAYPDVCPNINGVAAITCFFGGGTQFPSHTVGLIEPTNTWQLITTKNGTNGPADGKWGDYLTIRRHSNDNTSWIAAGYTLQGGPNRTNIQPRFVHFRI